MARQTPKAKARRRRAAQVAISNTRKAQRGAAIQSLNNLVAHLDLGCERLNVKAWSKAAFAKVLRVLARRCTADADAAALRQALTAYTLNGGALPEGMVLTEVALELPDDTSPVPYVPRHRVLATTFQLKSCAFMVTYNAEAFQRDTWTAFRDFIKGFAQRFGTRAWSACFEISLHNAGSQQQREVLHGHGYFIWTDGVGLRQRGLSNLVFQGVTPRVDVCRAPGGPANAGAPRIAALHGLWYVHIQKEGTLFSDSNWQPWKDYTPPVGWITSLWDQKKLSHNAFEKLSVEFRTGHSKRKRDLDDIVRQERANAVALHVAAESAAVNLKDPLQDFVDLPAENTFVDSFGEPARRKPILVYLGGTNTGKSQRARKVLSRIGQKLGLPSYHEVAVENDLALDLSFYDHGRHAGILLDGVGDVETLWIHREVLQGQPRAERGGRSATMCYAYDFTLARRAVVATMDLSAKNLHLLTTNHWLKDRRNVLLVSLAQPSWTQVVHEAVPPAARMGAWSVQEVTHFYEGLDAGGVAEQLMKNSVSGADLLAFNAVEELADDLRLTPFAARKILRLRDSFLTGALQFHF